MLPVRFLVNIRLLLGYYYFGGSQSYRFLTMWGFGTSDPLLCKGHLYFEVLKNTVFRELSRWLSGVLYSYFTHHLNELVSHLEMLFTVLFKCLYSLLSLFKMPFVYVISSIPTFLTDKIIRHRACTLKDTAHAIIAAELDPEFNKLCEEIKEARIKRGELWKWACSWRPRNHWVLPNDVSLVLLVLWK